MRLTTGIIRNAPLTIRSVKLGLDMSFGVEVGVVVQGSVALLAGQMGRELAIVPNTDSGYVVRQQNEMVAE